MGLFDFLGGVERQLNPFDNGKTASNPQGNGSTASTVSQVKNLGLGFLKGAVTPFVRLPMDLGYDVAKGVTALTGHHLEAPGNNLPAWLRPEGLGSVRSIAGNATQVGLSFLAPEAAGAVGDAVTNAGISGTFGKLLTGAATGAAVGAPFNVANTISGTQPLTPGSLLKSAAYGAGGGALLGGAAEGVGLAAKNITPLNETGSLNPQDITDLAKASTEGEVKQILGDKVTPEVAAEVAKPLSLTNNPASIQDIINSHSPTPPVSPETTTTPSEQPTQVGQGSGIIDASAITTPTPEKTQQGNKPITLSGEDIYGVRKTATSAEKTLEPKDIITTTPDRSTSTGSAQGATLTSTGNSEESSSRSISQTQSTQPTELSKQRQFIETVKNSPNVSPEVKAAVASPLVSRPDATLVANTQDFINQGLDKATQQVHEALDKPLGSVTDQDTSNAVAVAQAHDALGTDAGHEQAQAIYEKLAPQRTETARALRAGQILNSRTPDGLKYQAIKDLNKAGVKIEGDVQENLNNAIDRVRNTQPGTDEHTLAVGEVQKVVQGAIPSSAGDKAFALWRTGLLTGPSTIGKIITSHVGQGVFSIAKDYAGALVDKITSGVSGQRALVAPGAEELGQFGKGFSVGFGDMKGYIQTGLEKDPITGNALELRNTTNFQHQLFQNYTDWVGRVHGSLYKPFNTGETFRSLFNQATAEAKNLGLSGDAAQAHIQDFIKDPPKEAADTAVHEGQVATFQQETALGKAASQLQKLPVIGKLIAPFTKIPSAIATDLINATPIGAVRTILDGIKAAKSDEGWTVQAQREFSKGLGTAITGTAIMLPGIALFKKGVMTLGYPTDPNEQKLWAQEGKQPNSILIGGKWRSLGSFGPSGSVLEIGGHIANSLQQGNSLSQAITHGFVGGAQSIEEQSYLRGVSGAINALNDPGRYAGNFVKQTAGSIIPTGISTVAAATDKLQRQANSPLDTIKSRIPGLRESLQPKLDTFGNPLPNTNSGWYRIIDPFQSSTAQPPTPVVNELQRLQDAGFGITPAKVNKTVVFNKVSTPLTPNQQRQLTTAIGQATQAAWVKLVSRPGYQSLPDDQKRQALSTVYTNIATRQKQKFAVQNKVGRYSSDYLIKLHQPKKLQVAGG